MGIDVGSDLDAGVAEDGLDGFERGAQVQQQAGAGMPQVVNADA